MSQHLGLRRLLLDSTSNFVRQGLTVVLGLFTSAIIARGLGAEGRGIYALALLLPNFIIVFLSMGVGSATVYYVARGEYDIATAARANMVISAVISLAGCALGTVTLLVTGERLFPGASLDLLFLGLLIVPTTIHSRNLALIFQGIQDFNTYNRITLIIPLITLILNLALVWYLRVGVAGSIISLAFAHVASIGVAFFALRHHLKIQHLWSISVDRSYYRRIVTYGLRAHLSQVIAFLNYRLDVFLLGLLTSDPAEVGLYAVAVAIAERLWYLSSAVAQVLFPRIASLEGYDQKRNQLTMLIARHVLWLGIIAGIVGYVLADWGILLVYGPDYAETPIAFRWLLPGIVLTGMAKVLGNDIGGRGRPEVNSYQSAIAIVVNVICNIILIPTYGFVGAAMATTISYTVWTLIKVWYFSRTFDTRWHEVWLPNHEDVKHWRRAFALVRARIQRHR
jgi:O-antigen/teichoic acid export membrane protein